MLKRAQAFLYFFVIVTLIFLSPISQGKIYEQQSKPFSPLEESSNSSSLLDDSSAPLETSSSLASPAVGDSSLSATSSSLFPSFTDIQNPLKKSQTRQDQELEKNQIVLEKSAFLDLKQPALSLSDILTLEEQNQLSPEFLLEVKKELSRFNENPYTVVADHDRTVRITAFCVGTQITSIMNGVKVLKCIPVGSKKPFTIYFAIQGHYDCSQLFSLIGLSDSNFLGLSIGVAGILGFAYISCPNGNCYFSSPTTHPYDGISLSAAFFQYGGGLAYYMHGSRSVLLALYQAGLALDLTASKICIKEN
jgi:hypothetical protein